MWYFHRLIAVLNFLKTIQGHHSLFAMGTKFRGKFRSRGSMIDKNSLIQYEPKGSFGLSQFFLLWMSLPLKCNGNGIGGATVLDTVTNARRTVNDQHFLHYAVYCKSTTPVKSDDFDRLSVPVLNLLLRDDVKNSEATNLTCVFIVL